MALPTTNHDPAPSPIDDGLELPLDYFGAPGIGPVIHVHEFKADLAVEAAKIPGDEVPLTPADHLLAAFAIQLSRYNGQQSIPMHASRGSVGEAHQFTARALLHVGGGATARDVLVQARDLHDRSSDHVSLGITGGRDAAFTWLTGGSEVDLPAVLDHVTRVEPKGRPAALHLLVARAGDRHRGFLAYDSSLFRLATIERFAGHLAVLLNGLAAGIDLRASELPILTLAERRWLREVSEGPAHQFPGTLAHELIERRAGATPGAIAVQFRDESLTYGELNARANRLAHELLRRGIGAECRVVVCVEPGLDIVVALLGILKAGAVYVPVDPTYPQARVAAVLEETSPALVLAQRHVVDRLGLDQFPVLLLPLDAAGSPSDSDNLGTAVDRERTAYVYFTSGTTGRPKGVMASQANLAAYLQVAVKRYDTAPGDVIPAIARFTFSISMFELMLPLVSGGTLLVLERQHVLDLPRLAQTLSGVTFFHAGPSLLRNLLAHIKQAGIDFSVYGGVRHASSGGDMIAPEVLEGLKEVFSKAEVFVIYGCSEISCMGCTWPVQRGGTIARTYVGRPFHNMSVRVVDGGLQQVPVGIVGEILFSGAGVVKRYLNHDALTADRFVVLDGRRYYRTGDLGRINEEGDLEVLGRNDFQVKLRGMRIELAEVEHHLRRAPAVLDAVVTARAAQDGETGLVAYVVLEATGESPVSGSRTAVAAVRRYMADHLPDYMVPATYVQLERMPLNHNMKLDRRALPDPPRIEQRTEGDTTERLPSTGSERAIAALWSTLLQVDRVCIDDNFFELGGDSLRALDLVLRIDRELGCTVDGMDVLRESLEVLATICDRQRGIPAAARATSRPARARDDLLTTFHFGPGQSLYGVLQAPRVGATGLAALICAPMGHERVRTHFVVRRLARELVARGVTVLSFDYFGSGDSLGDSTEATCERWQRDVADACEELRRQAGKGLVGIGIRLGATLMCAARERLRTDFGRLVLWDPVTDGAVHYHELVRTHRAYVRALQDLRLGRPPRKLHGKEELMGATYSDVALQELRTLAIAPGFGRPAALAPVRWLATTLPAHEVERAWQPAEPGGSLRVEAAALDCHWQDAAAIDDMLPDVGIARTLASMTVETG
jgi:amino acid adenylation domain-containing protein